jgi:hypothetical protein
VNAAGTGEISAREVKATVSRQKPSRSNWRRTKRNLWVTAPCLAFNSGQVRGKAATQIMAAVEACTDDALVMPADAFAFNGEEGAILGVLQTRDGLRFQWDHSRLRVFHTEDGVKIIMAPGVWQCQAH